MRSVARGIALGVAAVVLVVAALALVTARRSQPALWPPEGGAAVEIFLVSNGYHAGIVVPTAKLSQAATWNGNATLSVVAEHFGSYPFIEIGWGEDAFYRAVPTVNDVTFGLAVRALFNPGNTSVLHVVGLTDQPRLVFRSADIVRVEVSEQGFAAMLKSLDATFARKGEPPAPEPVGKGLYGPSLFYRADRRFHLFSVCNHWAADMLSAAGLPVTPVLDTVPAGLLLDLKLRAGLTKMPDYVR